jgi:hypothetical protein
MNEEGRIVVELTDEKWLRDLALLCYISHEVKDLNTNHKGQEKLIYDMFGAVRACEMKLKLFRKQQENVDRVCDKKCSIHWLRILK